jgi:hypothetical protein
MKQCFTHRLPSPLTLLSDPWPPEDFAEVRAKVEARIKTAALPSVSKTARLAGPRVALTRP